MRLVGDPDVAVVDLCGVGEEAGDVGDRDGLEVTDVQAGAARVGLELPGAV